MIGLSLSSVFLATVLPLTVARKTERINIIIHFYHNLCQPYSILSAVIAERMSIHHFISYI